MKTQFQNMQLRYLLQKNAHQGFARWEVLLGIVIMGILSTIFIPPIFRDLSRCDNNKAKQAEAKNYLGTINRAQQAYFVEFQHFASSIAELQFPMKPQTENYNYSIRRVNDKAALHYAISRNNKLRSYVGAAYAIPAPKDAKNSQDNGEWLTISCESNSPTTKPPADPIYQKGVLACGEGTSSLSR